jgi:cytochrome c biogenesis protein CcdA
MSGGLLALAVTAGMLAAVNPCGFALLPAYLSLLVTGDQPAGRATAVRRALVLTAGMTAGFAAVFGIFGLVVSPVAASTQRYLPWFTVVLGCLLAGLGLWLLAGRRLPALSLHRRTAQITLSLRSMAAFGASYAIASIGCTIAPFLAIVVSSFRAGSVPAGVALFLAYAAGMGLVVGTAAVAVALARASLVGRLRRLGAVVPRLAGALLMLAGGYVAYYGWWEIRVLRGAAAAKDPVIALAGTIQRAVAGTLDRIGFLGLLAVLVLLVISGTGAWRRFTTAARRVPR